MYFLNINKPKGVTSFDVIRVLRKKLNIKSIGHSGTLDPLASGVLQVGVGGASKLLDYLNGDKTYIAEMKFGYSSSTLDDEGEKTFVGKPNFTRQQLENVIKMFIGDTFQIPPKYSAIKQNGQKLCDLMRKNPNAEIKITPRLVTIYSAKLLDFTGDCAKIKVNCKKGTYIRSLIRDIGLKLNCGAYMTDLVRISAGKFKIEDSDDLYSEIFNKIDPLQALDMIQLELNDEEYCRIRNGNYIATDINLDSANILLTKNNKLVSLGIISDNHNGCFIIKPRKNFNED